MGSEGETAVVKTATHRHLWSKRRGQNGHPQAPVVKTAWSKRPSTSPCGQNGVVKTAVHGLVVKPACGQNGQTCVVKPACGQNGHYWLHPTVLRCIYEYAPSKQGYYRRCATCNSLFSPLVGTTQIQNGGYLVKHSKNFEKITEPNLLICQSG